MNGDFGIQTSGDCWPEPALIMLYEGFQETPELPSPKLGAQILFDLEDQMARFEAEHEALVKEVRKHYVLPANSSVLTFFYRHRALPQLLLQAASHLKEYFGAGVVFSLRVPVDESGSQTLYAVAMWPGNVREVRNALEKFDDEWWIANSRQASGHLTFTYELV